MKRSGIFFLIFPVVITYSCILVEYKADLPNVWAILIDGETQNMAESISEKIKELAGNPDAKTKSNIIQ